MTAVTTVIDEALALPPADRSYVVQRLLVSLDEERDLSPAWREEIERRIAHRQRGETRPHTREEVTRDVESLLAS
jgi:putative addiction module component (TIGR02574 family)